MFTGIIEVVGIVESVENNDSNKTFTINAPFLEELKVDQSISHNGVCLTIEAIHPNSYTVTAIVETLSKTNLGLLKVGDKINLERCMVLNGRLDGHIVQGHVDDTATCIQKTDKSGSWEYRFEFHPQFAHLIIEKGSVCINGISLTAFNVTQNTFDVAIIPYTYHHTNIHTINPGSSVNIEYDVVGKYIARRDEIQKS